jgi:ATP-dependent Clp protease ATP-binding subunit ClpX
VKLLTKKRNVTCYCDFCGKSDDEVSKMIDGKHAFICDQCVEDARKLTRPQLALVK